MRCPLEGIAAPTGTYRVCNGITQPVIVPVYLRGRRHQAIKAWPGQATAHIYIGKLKSVAMIGGVISFSEPPLEVVQLRTVIRLYAS